MKTQKKNQKFIWGKEQQEAFQTLKQKLTSAEVMYYYNPIAETNIIVDAGSKGLGAILFQKQKNGQFKKPISYSSRALTDVESRYSQTKKEALAVAWAFQHYHYYIYDKHVTVYTDHKPLERLLTTSPTTPRIQRWLIRLQAYKYTIRYRPRIANAPDILSRSRALQASTEYPGEQHIHHIINEAVPVSMKLSDIITESTKDEMIKEAIKSLETNRWNKSSLFYKIRDELRTSKNILLKSNCIVIPQTLTQKILEIAHNQHQGISKTKARLRKKVWWPGLSADIENYIKSCYACQVTTPSTVQCEPLKMTEIPKTSWHTLALDIESPFSCGTNLLVLIDYRSRYPVVTSMKTVNSINIIKSLQKTFSLFGYLAKIITDNGPQFKSSEFKAYLSTHNIEHRMVTPYWPIANGEVERFNRTLGKAIKCAHVQGKTWKDELDKFLLEYRSTPHSVTQCAPSEIMFSHNFKTDIPKFQEKQKKNHHKALTRLDGQKKKKSKQYTDNKRNAKVINISRNNFVLAKDIHLKSKLSNFHEPNPYIVTKVYKRSAKIKK